MSILGKYYKVTDNTDCVNICTREKANLTGPNCDDSEKFASFTICTYPYSFNQKTCINVKSDKTDNVYRVILDPRRIGTFTDPRRKIALRLVKELSWDKEFCRHVIKELPEDIIEEAKIANVERVMKEIKIKEEISKLKYEIAILKSTLNK